MIELDITPDEVSSGKLADERLTQARLALRRDGIVILKNVVDVAHLDILAERMFADLETILNRTDAPFQFNTGNVQQDPPPFPPYLFRDILVNPIVVAVTKSILGPGLRNTFYSGNTALPGGTRQPVHSDTHHLWPDLEVAHPAHMLVVNIPIVDMDARNGSTEVWPGTHLDTTMGAQMETIQVPEATVEQRRVISPPLQPTVHRGSVVIRDMRLWHAGMPNHTDQPRPMLAMIHQVRWLPSGPLTFAKGSEAFLADSDLVTPAEFVDGPVNYLHRHESYDFKQASNTDLSSGR